MTRMTGPDYAVMCNVINTHTHTNTHAMQEGGRPQYRGGRGTPQRKRGVSHSSGCVGWYAAV